MSFRCRRGARPRWPGPVLAWPAQRARRPRRRGLPTAPAVRQVFTAAVIEREIANVAAPDTRDRAARRQALRGRLVAGGRGRRRSIARSPIATSTWCSRLGILTSQQAARRAPLPKPVIAPLVIDPILQGYPLVEGRSGRHNFTYVADFQSVANEVRAFHEIVGFKHLVALVDELAAGCAAGSSSAKADRARRGAQRAHRHRARQRRRQRGARQPSAGYRRGVRDAVALQRSAGARARARTRAAQATHFLGASAAAKSKPAC